MRPSSGLRMFAAGWSLTLCATVAADVNFERHEIVTGSAEGQTVLTGFLLGGAVADAAVLDDDRTLRIYRLDGDGFSPAIEARLREGTSFVDVAAIGGQDRLLVYGEGRLSWFDPASATERELLTVRCDFVAPLRSEIPHVDVSHDVNGDGLDDLLLPDDEVFWIATQTGDGAFSEPTRIGVAPGPERVYGRGGYRHDPWLLSGIHPIDYDRDGRLDLAVYRMGRFVVHRQEAGGRFVPESDGFAVAVPIDGARNSCARRPELGFDAVESCYEADHGALTRGDRTEKMVHGFSDFNGDGVADLIVYSLTGRSVFSVRSTYEIYLGRPVPGGTVFGPEIGAAIPSDALQVSIEPGDYDGDGQTDVRVTTFNVGFFKVAGALMSRSMSLGVEFFRMQDGRYADEPDTTRKLKLALSRQVAGKKAVAYAPLLVGDVDGDGRSDLLMAKGRKELRLFPGVAGPELFAQRPQKVKLAVPLGQEYVWMTDLDRDGRQDVLLHHPATEDEPGRVSVLIAR